MRARPKSSPFDCAARLIARRDHSRFDLERKLKIRSFTPDEIREVMAKLDELGLMREKEYVRLKVRALHRKGWAMRGIQLKLAQERIQCSASEIKEIFCDENLDESALLRKLLEQGKTPSSLVARGFSMDQIKRASQES